MNQTEFAGAILKNLPHIPTKGQQTLAELLADFIFARSDGKRHLMFLLKGYAGTGKTSMISSLVRTLPQQGKKTVLLAPTGRAAKVLSHYSGKPAFTIHRKIYMHQTLPNGGIKITLRQNLHKNTLFIVDEASMIQGQSENSDLSLFSSRNLLDDLIDYVYSSNCRLLLAGDTAQLPPVGMDISPALDPQLLKAAYPLQLDSYELTEVVRQEKESGILFNATLLRQNLKSENFKPPFFHLKKFEDIIRISGQELEDALNHSIYSKGVESTVVVTRSNKKANLFNREVRNRILFRDQEITAGDLIMVVKNNYFWLQQDSATGFIANGDTIEILKVSKVEEMYGFRFADVFARLVDYPEEPELEIKILLDTLASESASLSQEENRKLFEEVMKDYEDVPSRTKRFEELRNNPYFNALQVKFAYALTCHKTQGGQWEDVFIDQGYLPDDRMNREYLRWLYTALTRATRRVYLVNFNDNLFFT
jgi:exodeoxyribonuclease V